MGAIEELANLIKNGFPKETNDQVTQGWRDSIEALFGGRYHSSSKHSTRVVLINNDENVSFAGLIHQDNPNSGAYGGMCIVWFPIKSEDGKTRKSLLAFGCGTKGLAPDEGIISKPGHIRALNAIRKYLVNKTGCYIWCKQDPANLSQNIPDVIKEEFSDFKDVFGRYGGVLYCIVEVPQDEQTSVDVVKTFFDYYALERDWKILSEFKKEVSFLQAEISKNVFPSITQKDIVKLLKERRFVILQGPPGTGKTRMALKILEEDFQNFGLKSQFHPAVTYENFIFGINPNIDSSQLNFRVLPGTLLSAVIQALTNPDKDYLLVIDEINRADLSKILGEAIFLFEYKEINEDLSREIRLPYKIQNLDKFSIPKNLFVLGTMNSADRSIAIIDMAVRRRFAFVNLWPDIKSVNNQEVELANEAFEKIINIFIENASDESLVFLPGQSYFLAKSTNELINRFRYELIPLLEEYIYDGRIAAFETEIIGYIDWLTMQIMNVEKNKPI